MLNERGDKTERSRYILLLASMAGVLGERQRQWQPLPYTTRMVHTQPHLPDHYAALGVPRSATTEEIKTAYRKLGTVESARVKSELGAPVTRD